MNVNIETVHFTADAKLIDHVNKKVQKLTNFYDRIVSVDVFLKLDNVAHQIKDKIAEIKIRIPRQDLFVKYETKSFEESFDLAFNAAVTQIKRQKEKKFQ